MSTAGVPDRVPDWLATGECPVVVTDLWPEDVLSEEEWDRGWFDRKLIAGEVQEWERAVVPRWFGGDAP